MQTVLNICAYLIYLQRNKNSAFVIIIKLPVLVIDSRCKFISKCYRSQQGGYMFDLTGQTALVTGSSQGIGLSIAEALGKAGATVAINGRDPNKVTDAMALLTSKGINAVAVPFDVTQPDEIKAAVEALNLQSGGIDILVNNAGMQIRGPLEDYSQDDWRTLFATNIDSVFYVSQAVVKGMIKQGHGKIINIASVQSELARPGIAPYTATKGAIKNLTKGMCTDWAKYGIQINAIGPGYFDTPLNKALVENPEFDAWIKKRTPAGRWGKLEDLHGAAVFLASKGSDFVNGQTLYVDGGIVSCI